jgi:hypothetical protein
MKEQSSILKPNNKLVGVKPSKQEPKLPKPTGWRLLVLPFTRRSSDLNQNRRWRDASAKRR